MTFEELTRLYPADGLAVSAKDGRLCWVVELEGETRRCEVPLTAGLQQLTSVGHAYWHALYAQLEKALLYLRSTKPGFSEDEILDSMDIVWSNLSDDMKADIERVRR